MNAFSRRIHILNRHSMDNRGKYILYWMQQSQRAYCNHALEYAINLSNEAQKPLITVFILNPQFPESNIRHMQFMIQGLIETGRSMKERNIPFIVKMDNADDSLCELISDACCVITDMGYMRYQREWRQRIGRHTDKHFIAVEGDIIVPVEMASNKEEYGAYTIRGKINKLRAQFMKSPNQGTVKQRIDPQISSVIPEDIDMSLFINDINASPIIGGYSEAYKKLSHFLEHNIHNYTQLGSNPAADVHSHLSPYIHFGQISVIEIALAVMESRASNEDKEAFLEQLIVRRELAMNFVYYNRQYDSLKCLPQWVQNTLNAHRKDKRPYMYTADELEGGHTHDDIWNKAQNDMIKNGTMHNYLRMYWGKKIIEWTADYESALSIMIYLNNRYQLDGRDANAYAGIMWCFGKHDRAFKERPVLGKLRYMSYNGVKRKMKY